jgi:hypothetical protein
VLLVGGVAAAAALANLTDVRARLAALLAALALLAIAPAAWSADTLGYATSGTFPAGGPSQTASAGPGGGFGRGGFGPPAGFGGGGGGGMFGGDTSNLQAALAYAQANGGGTIAVSSQSGAAGAIIASGAHVAGIGGFSGRESEVTLAWLARAVADGRIRFVVASSDNGGAFRDGRTGASAAMAAVQQACTPVSSVSGLYDCQGRASAISSLSNGAS